MHIRYFHTAQSLGIKPSFSSPLETDTGTKRLHDGLVPLSSCLESILRPWSVLSSTPKR